MIKFDLEHARLAPGFWYLATPYSNYAAGHAVAAEHASIVAGELIRNGVILFAAIAHGHAINAAVARRGVEVGTDWATWRALNETMMRAAYGMLLGGLPGWEKSEGVLAERAHFEREGKPVLLLNLGGVHGAPDWMR